MTSSTHTCTYDRKPYEISKHIHTRLYPAVPYHILQRPVTAIFQMRAIIIRVNEIEKSVHALSGSCLPQRF